MPGNVCAYACLVAVIFASVATCVSDDDEQPPTSQLLMAQQRPAVYADTMSDYLGDYAVYPGVSNEDFAANRDPPSMAVLFTGGDTADSSDAADDGAGDDMDRTSIGFVGDDGSDFAARAKRRQNSFIRLGRAQQQRMKFTRNAIRMGRSGALQPSRQDNFMRFGRAGSTRKAASNFVRFGRGNENDFPEAMRFIRRGDSFIRFGKRSESTLDGRATRSNAASGQMGPISGRAATDGLNRIERNDKQYIRFGRRDDSFVRLGKKKSIGPDVKFYKALKTNASDNMENSDTNSGDGGRIADEPAHVKFV